MCSAKKPDISNKQQPLKAQVPEEETTVILGTSGESSKEKKRKAATGTRQLMIPTGSSLNSAAGSKGGLSL